MSFNWSHEIKTKMNKITTDYFLSHILTGLATQIAANADNPKRITIPVSLQLSATEKNKTATTKTIQKKIAIYGPGDILGFNESAILNTFPTVNTFNFRSNLIPFIEFEEADFLWRYSTTQANEGKNWIPWLSLIILKDTSELEAGEFSYVPPVADAPVHCIQLSQDAILPDLKEAWRWAHIHITEEAGLDLPAIKQIIRQAPQKAACRLMAPRRLKTKTKYTAFVIPTYQLGIEAALGVDISLSTTNKNTLAWNTPKAGQGQILPFYHKWSFQTGERGDFEYLLRQLEGRQSNDVGQRPIDCSRPGYGMGQENNVLQMEGALKAPDMDYQQWGLDTGAFNTEQKELADLLNKAETIDEHGEIALKVVPPIYGRWYRAAADSDFNLGTNINKDKNWITELNLDYRHRAAAGLGVAYVKENQEDLMNTAWKQLASAKKVNQRLNYARFGRAVSNCLYKRFQTLDKAQLLRLGLPLKNRIKMVSIGNQVGSGSTPSGSNPPKSTINDRLNQSDLPNIVVHNKLKKYLVSKFDYTKQVQAQVIEEDPLVHTNANTGIASGASGDNNTPTGDNTALSKKRTGFGLSKTTKPTRGLGAKGKGTRSYQVNQQIIDAETVIGEAGTIIKKHLDPNQSIEKKWCKKIEKFRDWEARNNPKSTSRNSSQSKGLDPLAPIMWYPEFPMPMYQYLRDQAPNLLLPGLNRVPPNTISLLEVNPRFIESFMIGLNHEMAAELRWRKFPTDMRGNYFRKFWDTTVYSVNEEEKQLFSASQIGQRFFEKITQQHIQTIGDIDALYNKPVRTVTEAERKVLLDYEQAIEKWLLTRANHKDIQPPLEWTPTSRLGTHSVHANAATEKELVLLLRSDLLLRIPNARIYLAKSISDGDERIPDYEQTIFPVFEGNYPPDFVFLGFPIPADKWKDYFMVFEEPWSQTTLGLDEVSSADINSASSDTSWQHFDELVGEAYLDGLTPQIQSISTDEWANPAYIAKICTQKSVRLSIPLSRFLSRE